MGNRLADETSPYLLQHKDNPVDWHAWGPAALAEARAPDKPILLSVGYAACHWCHVMAHESFEDAETAALMNELFVNIKVDREERPDIDAIYQHALHAARRARRLAADHVPDASGRAVLGRHLFPAEAALRPAGLRRVLRADRARSIASEPRQGRASNVGLLREALAQPRAPSAAAGDRRRRCSIAIADAPGRARSTPSMAASAARPNSRRRRSSGCCGAAATRTGDAGRCAGRRRSRSTRIARAASTTTSAAASPATRPTRAGWCRTSRRCSTTTRCSSTCDAAPGRRRGKPLYAQRVARDGRLAAARDDRARAAASPPRSMPTARARRASSTSGRRPRSRACSGRRRRRLRRRLRRHRRTATGKATPSSTAAQPVPGSRRGRSALAAMRADAAGGARRARAPGLRRQGAGRLERPDDRRAGRRRRSSSRPGLAARRRARPSPSSQRHGRPAAGCATAGAQGRPRHPASLDDYADHLPRRAGPPRGHRRARLSRRRPRPGSPRSTRHYGDPTPAAISSPPTTPAT